MVAGIGRSTDPSTANHREDVSGSEPASFRYNNPGAQYPSAEAARFGQTGYGIIGGRHKIACFPSPVNGAACNFDLLNRRYTGKTIGEAGKIWTGQHGFGVPGYDPNKTLTKEMLDDLNQAIALLKAIANRESGCGNNLTEEQWRQAHRMFKAGSADAYLNQLPVDTQTNVPVGAKTGAGLLKRAREHIGEQYRNVLVPKDDPNWKGPWDCAEFMSWLVFQEANILYGCLDDHASPAKADAYTGAWKTDADRLGRRVSVEEAAATIGGIVLRYPPGPGKMGHIALCDGRGGTVEAKGRRYGVVADTVHGRVWHTGVLIPEITYDSAPAIKVTPPATVYAPNAPNMNKEIVVKIQEALAAKGFNPGMIDGDFGPDTEAAVVAFQEAEGLVVDGIVGPETAAALGVSLTGEGPVTTPTKPAADMTQILSILQALKGILEQPAKDGGTTMPTPANSPVSFLEEVAKFLQSISQQSGSDTQAPADQQIELLRKAVEVLLPLINPAAAGDKKAPLGQVNGALGQAIGNLLNGKKTALGVIGTVLTAILSSPEISSAITKAIPALASAPISSVLWPLFLALTGWGVLGKMEKWTQTAAQSQK